MDMSDASAIGSGLRGELRRDEPMARHVSWRAGGAARIFYHPADVDDLGAFLRVIPAQLPVLFVGLGSNLLVRDGGFDGAAILTHRALQGVERLADAVGSPRMPKRFHAAAGVPAPHLARFVAKHGGGGAEWMAGVPGTVGGALAMNAGCYGGETWNHVVEVETIDRAGRVHRRAAAEFETGYRHVAARFEGEEFFVGATFAFAAGEEGPAMAGMRELLARRVATQPLGTPNAGSVFRNPPDDHAARLIESCGLKGYTVGGARVSPKHANFIVNEGNASAADIEAVIAHVELVVAERTNVSLIREVRIVGDAR